jgi:competence protein ComFB
MEPNNIIEGLVIPEVNEIYESIEKKGNAEGICTCQQCRMDTACYVLNRMHPYYVVSNRGVASVQIDTTYQQQLTADIASLIHEGIETVHHNQRFKYEHTPTSKEENNLRDKPVYSIPAISGRLFDGGNFAPISAATVKLLFNGEPAEMQKGHWHNPLHIDSHSEGTFSFWPVPVVAKEAGEKTAFQFTIKVEAEGYEPMTHSFRIPLVSELLTSLSFTLEKSFKVPDLFMFPHGEDENHLYLD